MAKKERAALICRVSTAQQIELGLESQVACLKEKAINDGYEVPDDLIFQEQISGLDANKDIRQSLKDLMTAVENHKVDVVYTYELTRISRDPYNLVERVKWFSDRKIPMYIYDAELWTLDRTTKEEIEETTNYVFGAATYGKIEAKKIKKRTMRARDELAKGGWYVGHLSDGYITKLIGVHKKIVIDKDRKGVIERIFDLFVNGKSTDEIAQILNDDGVPTTNKYRLLSPHFNYNKMYMKGGIEYERNNVKWQGALIGQILSNKWYIGVRSYKKELYEIPRIITDDVWQKTVEMRTLRSAQFRTHRNKRKHNYLLTNYIFCGKCGRKMYGHTTGQNNHYFCSSYEEGKKCGLRGVCKENIEAIVCKVIKMRAVRNLLHQNNDVSSDYFKLPPQEIDIVKKKIKQLKETIRSEEKAIEKLENRRDNYFSMMADGMDKKRIKKLLEKDEKEQVEHEKRIGVLLSEIDSTQRRLKAGQDVVKIIKAIENTNDYQSLRQLIEKTIHRVEVYNADQSISLIRMKYLNGKEDTFIYSYPLLKDKFIYLPYITLNKIPISIDIEANSIIIQRGSIAFGNGILLFSEEYPPRTIKKDLCRLYEIALSTEENVNDVSKYIWYNKQISIRDFVLNARKSPDFCPQYDRTIFEEDDERRAEQKEKYKEWRKKYNTNLPTCVPYVVKDGNYKEYLEQRKHLYNRKYKVKKNKRLSDEQKAEELERIDEALSLLKAKVRYLSREEAVKEYKKGKE